jgi:hypothetical protein
MIDHLTWHQTANLWWITMALGFGWRMGQGIAAPVVRVLRRRITFAIIRAIDPPREANPSPPGPDRVEVNRDMAGLDALGTLLAGKGDEDGWLACRSAEETMHKMARMLTEMGHPLFTAKDPE